MVETDDGAHILMTYRGVRTGPPRSSRECVGEYIDPAQYYFRIVPFFEKAAEKYAWLNSIVSVGFGDRVKAVRDTRCRSPLSRSASSAGADNVVPVADGEVIRDVDEKRSRTPSKRRRMAHASSSRGAIRRTPRHLVRMRSPSWPRLDALTARSRALRELAPAVQFEHGR